LFEFLYKNFWIDILLAVEGLTFDLLYTFVAGTPPPAYQPHDDNANMNNQNRNNHPRPHHQPMDTMPTPSHGNRVAGKQSHIKVCCANVYYWGIMATFILIKSYNHFVDVFI
jgi:hypothetical protein